MNDNKTRASLPPNAELRTHLGKVELRANPDDPDSPGTLYGYAAVYNSFSVDLGGFREKLAPGCFADCMKDDVRCLKNHSENHLLGRSVSNTLRYEEDDAGLKMAVDLPKTSVGRDCAEEIRRGDMTGQSFCFVVAEDGEDWDWSGPMPIRTITRVARLYDVGPVTYPAYEGTDIALRSMRTSAEQRDEARAIAAGQALSSLKARLQLAKAAVL